MTQPGYQIVPFLQAVKDCTGGNPKVQRKDYQVEGDISVIDQGQDFIAGFTDSDNSYRGSLPLILFGDHTRTFKYVDFPFALGADGVKALEPLEGFNAKFLHYYFRSVRLPNAGYSRHFKFLKRIDVPKPALPEQRRIVDLLSRAEGIVRLRREAETCAAQLIPALFLDLFGDPATNPKGWAVATIADLCRVQTGATPSRENPEYYENGQTPWIKTAEVNGSTITEADEFISESALLETNCKVFPVGTILVAMYGQGKTRGRSAVLGIPAATNQACAAILPSDKVKVAFLFCFLQSQYEQLRGMARGGNQANLNLSMIKGYPIILPPFRMQEIFAEKMESIHSIQSQQSAATAKAQAAFDALLASCFDPATTNNIRGAA